VRPWTCGEKALLEDYAVSTRIGPSAAVEAAIEQFLAEGLWGRAAAGGV